MNRKRKLFVLLTRNRNLFSDFIYWISGRGYTHASISIDEEQECFYSFNFRGFCEEHPFKWKKEGRKSVCYQFDISEDDYEKIQKKLKEFISRREQYQYSRLGLALCIVRIPYKRKSRYFCSQFVAEILELTESFCMKKNAALYLPNQFTKELAFHPALNGAIYQEG